MGRHGQQRRSPTRVATLAALVGLTAVACGGGSDPAQPDGTHSAEATTTCTLSSTLPNGKVANAPTEQRDFPWDRADPVVLEGFRFEDVQSGGPPPDGIRPIDEPCFDEVGAVTWLIPQSPVLVVEVGDDVRAYPLAIMTQHEIANDVVAGVPVVVTYCPLCNSGLAFERTVQGRVLDFGTSGRLFQSNLVMYDRQTKTLWTQFTGRAVVGADFVGTELERLPTSLLSFEEFVAVAPDGLVLSPDTFPGRDYGRNPYPGYEGRGDRFLFEGPRDDQLEPNTRVVGLGTDVDPLVIALPQLQELRVVEVEVGPQVVTVWWSPGQSSALDADTVDDGVDVGSTVAFVAEDPAGAPLTFTTTSDPDLFRDEQTGSTWNLRGLATDGELDGSRLQPVAHDDTFWFVWFAFQPATRVLSADAY